MEPAAISSEVITAIYAILAIAGEINIIVKRLDDRRRHANHQVRYTESVQDLCYEIWQEAQTNPLVRSCSNSRVKYADAFRYYSRVIIAAGVKDAETFAMLIERRRKRQNGD